jgi:hypothetical protein
MAEKIPMSENARNELKNARSEYNLFALMMVAVIGVITLIFAACGYIALGASVLYDILRILIIETCGLSLWWLLVRNRYLRRRNLIISENEDDYKKNLRLQKAVKEIGDIETNKAPIAENPVEGEWKPFRVEHFISDNLKGYIPDDNPIIAKPRYWNHKPANILDSSSILFLSDGAKTLRLLVPGPKAVKDFFLNLIGSWKADVRYSSHCRNTLEDFRDKENDGFDFPSDPRTLDLLDESCGKPISERPVINFKGQKLQDGIYLATALEVDGKETVIFPSGYFNKAADLVAAALENREDRTE